MSSDIASTVTQRVARLRELYIDEARSQWEAAANGTPDNLEKAARLRAEMMQFWADQAAFDQLRAWDQSNAASSDPILARQIRLLHYGFAQGQRDPDTIEELTNLMKQVEEIYFNFRGQVDGQSLNNNALDKILHEELDSDVRRKAWEAGKQIGPLAAPTIRQLARVRNRTAHQLGYTNYHRMSLTLDEIDPDWLYAMLDDLAARTDAPFRDVKGELDTQLGQRFKTPVEELRPWHYADMFFQEAPQIGGIDLDPMFEGQKLEDLATRTYDGLGMDVRDILARSDLYERQGKDQHAFCTHIDREGDVRALCNLQPNLRWMTTLLHELGHAVFDKYIPLDLPWLLRTPAHTLTTEAMAILMGGLSADCDWLTQIRGLPACEIEGVGLTIRKHQRLAALIFARWVMVMVNFERALYEDPERDLDTLWWSLVEKYQFVRRPEGRSMPDWATKYHVALVPAYYQNYLIGKMVSIQWEHWLADNVGSLVNSREAGDYFRQRVFAPGATRPWNDALEYATGEKLNIGYYAEKYVTA